MENKDLTFHYDAVDIEELPSILECDWGIPIRKDLSDISDIDRWHLMQFIQVLDGASGKQDGEETNFNDLIDPYHDVDLAGVARKNGSVSVTLNFKKAHLIDIYLILLGGIKRSDTTKILNLLRKIVKIRYYEDGPKCVLYRAFLISNNRPKVGMDRDELNPYSCPDGLDRLCEPDVGEPLPHCQCREGEGNGCLLKPTDVDEILREFVIAGVLTKDDSGKYHMGLFNFEE